ncbi:hypothetical protein ALI144C_10485 [Actinosynnema sp. ALI-1.44]|uniref:alpha/beta fold hydrolase n=1 Tax=Actinosynnema sp. ALI-1.44 TaxID=1933779 RepID=UPI00097C3F3A|nr:hypothetical protein [Actinosynnema sp. ALI-1.44]ONI87050.1 hypothetical protein ALI144C_10485 [Actinosynnema sp. ALI-1.44]
MPDDYRVLAIDLAEHGESRSTRNVWTMAEFARDVRRLVDGGSPAGTEQALKDRYFTKMAAVRQPAGLRSIEGLIRWDMDAALRETRQPITVFAVRGLVAQEVIDRFEYVLVDLGSNHFQVESPEGTAKLASVVTP